MMGARVWQGRIGILCLLVMTWGRLISTAAADPSKVSTCPIESVTDWIFGFVDRSCIQYGSAQSPCFVGVTEGDEVSLQNALNMVHRNGHKYVALLFYASWCPFSKNFIPNFSQLSSFYPFILHLAIEESSVRPSILSKYGVHGFPSLFLLNSTMREQYHGSRTLGSLVAFYTDVTGMKTASPYRGSLYNTDLSNHEKHDNDEQESCPFSWARSPENLFRQETYLALATAFVLVRVVYLFFPTLLVFAKFAWRRHVRNLRLGSLLEHPRAYLNQIIQVFNSLKEPCRKSNLHEGALNARAWASKSLATLVNRGCKHQQGAPISECR